MLLLSCTSELGKTHISFLGVKVPLPEQAYGFVPDRSFQGILLTRKC